MTTTREHVILFDIDGTVADLSHRLHFVTSKTPDWKSFNANIPYDSPIEQTQWLQTLLHQHSMKGGPKLLFASGRSEDERKMTETWLAKYGFFYEKLYMRPAGDYRPDYVIKLELLDQMRADGYEPFIVVDDRQSVTDAWREAGLFVLQCDPNRGECLSDVYKFHESIKYPLTIMVGPSGAGKSTWLNRLGYNDIISSDTLRDQICGDFRVQSQNERVFRTMHELADKRLKAGLPVILDATHIRRADRLKSALIAPKHIPVRYVVINRPLKEKMASAGWRSGVMIKDKSLVEAHDQTFKSNLKDILKGDDLPNVTVEDFRT